MSCPAACVPIRPLGADIREFWKAAEETVDLHSREESTGMLRGRDSAHRHAGAVAVAVLASVFSAATAARPQSKSSDLTSASLEDPMNMQVTSVSKNPQKLSRTASAVFVITQEDIRRSGALDIPDLLRMVPGVDVAQINASTWAITVRGFNSRFSDELLVLLNGRSVYIETFGGVSGMCWTFRWRTSSGSK